MMVIINYRSKFLTYFAVSYACFSFYVAEGYLGMNWGRMATQRMIPSMVVDMMLQNNISNVKTFSSSKNVLEAFGGTGIQVDISVPNEQLKNVNTTEFAGLWIADHIKPYLEMNITFRYLYVGISPLWNLKPNSTTPQTAVRAMGVMQRALEINNIKGITAIFNHGTEDILLTPLTKPSMTEIKPDVKELVIEYCTMIRRTRAPFGLNIFPLSIIQENFNNDTEFGFFENNSLSKFRDGEFFYNNVFEVMYDSVASALEKLGFPDLRILVAATGWPTDGIQGGNIINAERFLQGLAKFVRSQKGTPKRPGNIDVYIHSIVDESAVSAKFGPYMRHWGIYKYDGEPKFNLDFTGNERKVKPVSAVGIVHMPKRWCVLDMSKINPNRIPFEALDVYYNVSCTAGDCTSMAPGGSCSGLPYPMNYSYAFNAGFQSKMQNIQKHDACNYGGYGMLVSNDPSTPYCTFPIQIIAAETTNFLGYRFT